MVPEIAETGALGRVEIRRMAISNILPANYNPRKALKPGDKEFEALNRSIEEFGLVDPLIWNKQTGTLVGGHQRLTVLLHRGCTDVDVSVVDLPVEREKALNVSLNKIEGAWDNKKLAELLDSLGDPMREVTGFTEVEIDEMLGEKKSRERVPKDTGHSQYTKQGDVWLLGDHRLACGDSCCASDIDRLMAGEVARLVVTDPPYNVNYGDKAEMLEDYLGAGNRITSAILNDNMDDTSFRKFLLDAYTQMYRVMADGAAIYVFHSETEGINFRTAFKEAGFYLSQCLIWLKSSIVLGRNDYHWRHEPALYGWKDTGTHKWYGGRKRSTALAADGLCVTVKKEDAGDVISFSDGFNNFVIRARDYEIIDDGHDDTMTVIYYDKPASSDIHPTMKPVGLLVKLVKNSSRKGEIVLDPFGGSGSTLMACEETGRLCRTMELDAHYCDVIVERYIEATSRQDVFLVRGGERIPYGDVHG